MTTESLSPLVVYIMCERTGTNWKPVARLKTAEDMCRAVAETKFCAWRGCPRLLYFMKVQTVEEWRRQKNYLARFEDEAQDIS